MEAPEEPTQSTEIQLPPSSDIGNALLRVAAGRGISRRAFGQLMTIGFSAALAACAPAPEREKPIEVSLGDLVAEPEKYIGGNDISFSGYSQFVDMDKVELASGSLYQSTYVEEYQIAENEDLTGVSIKAVKHSRSVGAGAPLPPQTLKNGKYIVIGNVEQVLDPQSGQFKTAVTIRQMKPLTTTPQASD